MTETTHLDGSSTATQRPEAPFSAATTQQMSASASQGQQEVTQTAEAVQRYQGSIDLTGLSPDYYFPVWWQMPSNHHGNAEICFTRVWSDDMDLDVFGDNNGHVAGLNLQLEGCAYLWKGDAHYLQVKRLSQTYRETVRQIQYGMLCTARHATGNKPLLSNYTDGQIVSSGNTSGLYLRGGLHYQLHKNFVAAVSYSSTFAEVSIGKSIREDWEIDFVVKPYHQDDAHISTAYPLNGNLLPYVADYDQRYQAAAVKDSR